jgi:hypothetical protein
MIEKNSTKFKNGKKISQKSTYRFSGLKRKEKELVIDLVRNTELLSLIHESIHDEIELATLSKEDQVIALLHELKFMRKFFSMAVVICHEIGIVHEEQVKEGSAGGRRKNHEVKQILMEICLAHFKKYQNLPTGQQLLTLFNEHVAPLNEVRKKKSLTERANGEQLLLTTQRTANTLLRDIKHYLK